MLKGADKLNKDEFSINRETLLKIGILPREAIHEIECTKGDMIFPYLVKIHQTLKLPPVPSS